MINNKISLISTISLLNILNSPVNIRPELKFLLNEQEVLKKFREYSGEQLRSLFIRKIGQINWRIKGEYKYLTEHYNKIVYAQNNAYVRPNNPITAIKKLPRNLIKESNAIDGYEEIDIFPALFAIYSVNLIYDKIKKSNIQSIKINKMIQEAIIGIKKLLFTKEFDTESINFPYSNSQIIKIIKKPEFRKGLLNVNGTYQEISLNICEDAPKKFVRKLYFAARLPQAHIFMIQNSDIFFKNYEINELNRLLDFMHLRLASYEPKYYTGEESVRLLPSKYQRDTYYKIYKIIDYKAKDNLDNYIIDKVLMHYKNFVIYAEKYRDTITQSILLKVKKRKISTQDIALNNDSEKLLFILFAYAYYLDLTDEKDQMTYNRIGARTRYGILTIYKKYFKNKNIFLSLFNNQIPKRTDRWFNDANNYRTLVMKNILKVMPEKTRRHSLIYYINSDDETIFDKMWDIIKEIVGKIKIQAY